MTVFQRNAPEFKICQYSRVSLLPNCWLIIMGNNICCRYVCRIPKTRLYMRRGRSNNFNGMKRSCSFNGIIFNGIVYDRTQIRLDTAHRENIITHTELQFNYQEFSWYMEWVSNWINLFIFTVLISKMLSPFSFQESTAFSNLFWLIRHANLR